MDDSPLDVHALGKLKSLKTSLGKIPSNYFPATRRPALFLNNTKGISVFFSILMQLLYKRDVSVPPGCPTYCSPVYSEIGDGLSQPPKFSDRGALLPGRQRILESRYQITNPQKSRHDLPPVNGEYCSKCHGGAGAAAAGPAQQMEAFQQQQMKALRTNSTCRAPKSTESVPSLQRIKLFRSRKPRPEQAVTIVTQLSLERIHMLEQQCSLWPQQIAAAFYIPLVQGKIFSAESSKWDGAPLEEALAAVAAMHAALEKNNTCILDVDLVVEEMCTPQKALDYPVNALRNRALLLASTELVLLLDVDFIVDQNLARGTTANATMYTELVGMLSQGAAMVLPAFETADEGDAGVKLAVRAVQRGKSYLVPHLKVNDAFPFHGCYFPVGQGATESVYWIRNATTKPYRILYEEYFEPYLLMKKSLVPLYDERFTGRHRNKMQHIMHVAVQSRMALVVHPLHFVIHLPHKKSFASKHQEHGGEFGGVYHKLQMEDYYQEAMAEMETLQFVPVTSFSHLCSKSDAARKLQPAAAAAAVGAGAGAAAGEKTKLPDFVDYFEDGVGETWDCYNYYR